MAHVSAVFSQRAFRLRNDDGSQTTATWKAAENATAVIQSGARLRVRLLVQETAGGDFGSNVLTIQANINGAGWFTVGASTADVYRIQSNHVAHGTNTTRQLATGVGSFIVGKFVGIGTEQSVSITANNHTEFEWSMFVEGSVANGSTIQFRALYNGAVLNQYEQIAEVTVDDPPEPITDAPTLAQDGPAGPWSAPLAWTAAAGATGYQVRDEDTDLIVATFGDVLSGNVTGLNPDTVYPLQVRGVNSVYEGPWSNVVMVTTDEPADLPTIVQTATSNDQSSLVAQVATVQFSAEPITDQPTVIEVDTSIVRQTIVGFGAAMTEASGVVLDDMTPAARDQLMAEFFGPAGARLSFLRLPLGASDYGLGDYTYADVQGPAGDPLANFSIDREDLYVVPRLQQALALNPQLKFMASPWSAPAWMRENNTLKGDTGGPLLDVWMPTYAEYFVRYVQAMAARGITIDYVTPQNEPGFAPSYIGMTMTAEQQIEFVRDHLRPAFDAAGVPTQIIGYDHNWDTTEYPMTLLDDAGTKAALGGIAWHGYLGEPSGQSVVRDAHPDVDQFFTEITEFGDANFSEDLRWNTRTITIGSLAHWAKTAATWNLVLDTDNGPINGGATDLRGLAQVDRADSTYEFQPAYYSLAQASRFIIPGSWRVARMSSNPFNIIHTEAYRTPDGDVVLHVLNDGGTPQLCTVKWDGFEAEVELVTGVNTLVWDSGVPPADAAGTAAWSEEDDGWQASGEHGGPQAAGTVAWQELPDSWTAAAVVVQPPPVPTGIGVTVDGTTLIYDGYEVTA